MKKYTFIFCYLFIISCSLFAQNKVTIGVMSDTKSIESDTLFSQLKSELNTLLESRYILELQEVVYNNNDIATAKNNYDSLINNNCDIILSIGVTNALMFDQYKLDYPVPTILVGFINNDFSDTATFNDLQSDIHNFTYFITPFSYKEDIDTFEALVPMKKVGIVVDDYLLNSLPLASHFQKMFADKSSDFIILPINNKNPENIVVPSDVDAIYLYSTAQLKLDQLTEFIEYINDLKLPSFSAYGVRDVELGVLATNQPKINFKQIFRRISLTVESIMEGEKLEKLPVEINYNKELTVNITTANIIDISLKNSDLVKFNLIENDLLKDHYHYSLKEVMHKMVNNNLALDVERKSVAIKEQEVRLSKSNYLPDLTVNGGGAYLNPEMAELSFGQNPEYSVNGSVQLKQTIYSASASANISISKSELNAQKEEYNSTELDAIMDVGVAYFNTLISEKNKSIQYKNLSLTKENLKLSEQNIEFGTGGKSDVLRFRSQLAENIKSMIEAENSTSQSYLVLNKLLNLPMSDEIALNDNLASLQSDLVNEGYNNLMDLLENPRLRLLLTQFLINEAKTNSPELHKLDFNRETVATQYRLNKNGRFVPTISLQGQYNQVLFRDGAGVSMPVGMGSIPLNNYTVGMNVSIPIFQQNTRNINKQKSKIQYDQLKTQRTDYELSIEKYVYELVLNLINEIANIEISKANMEVAKENVALSQSEYIAGIIPVIQLIDAQNNLLETELSLATAQYNYFIVSLQLQRTIGHYFLLNTADSNLAFINRAEQFITNK
ncbi:hypothetical protein EI427_22215 [Flammeovirga pectinis]|uniref:TolC family protein n=1 Tax=Flammeovirga pectinis TaxID=2494373 RepID=A0A3S9P9T8_9BACT|nr:TolC family protein [Flammeovirga pectinis]AZQ64944.1 hypothetical protein EI427_22215 [Flammeovirga pectinis]